MCAEVNFQRNQLCFSWKWRFKRNNFSHVNICFIVSFLLFRINRTRIRFSSTWIQHYDTTRERERERERKGLETFTGKNVSSEIRQFIKDYFSLSLSLFLSFSLSSSVCRLSFTRQEKAKSVAEWQQRGGWKDATIRINSISRSRLKRNDDERVVAFRGKSPGAWNSYDLCSRAGFLSHLCPIQFVPYNPWPLNHDHSKSFRCLSLFPATFQEIERSVLYFIEIWFDF